MVELAAATALHDTIVEEHEAAIIAPEDNLRRRAEAEKNDVIGQVSACRIRFGGMQERPAEALGGTRG